MNDDPTTTTTDDPLDATTSGDELPTAEGETETPIADALDEAAGLEAIVDEVAEETLEAAAVEATQIEIEADLVARDILEEAAEEVEELEEAGQEDAAEAVAAQAIEDAAIVEVIGDELAGEVLAEAVIEVAVIEEAASEVEDEVLAAAAEVQPVVSDPGDPFGGPGDWYVVHTYAGYENKVKTNLESRIHTMQMEEKIFNVHIPMEDVMEIKGGKKQVVQKKVFPGYLLVKMTYDNDSWYVVRNTPGVTGFVSAGTGSKPTPLSRREVEKILVVKKEEVKPQFRLGFEENDVVRIISGPFADFNGTISEINVDQSKLKVLVNIFDRETPVELGFDQVSKV
ncbi:MAG: transcription termination/antitermination protein NusG [Actinomycetota bacterium]